MCPNILPISCPPVTACLDILTNNSNSVSGYYNIPLLSDDNVYCDMEGDNCDGEGGWTRIGYINTTEPNATCPPGLQLEYSSDLGYNACIKANTDDEGCNSTYFSTNGYNYSKVCGQARGYTDHGHAFHSYITDGNGLESYYVDGISITTGANPRHHIWTYAAGNNGLLFDSKPQYAYQCPCSTMYNYTVPDVVGSNYYCEGMYYGDFSDPLWDGKNCTSHEEPLCCSNSKMPWFVRSLDEETSDDIEVRLCSNDHNTFPIDILEIYVK